MITFPHGITDEEIETMAEEQQKDVNDAVHDLQIKRKKLVETGVSEDDEKIKGIDFMVDHI
jgi:hypothetical protein